MLKVNAKKSKALVFEGDAMSRCYISLNGKELEPVDFFLGIWE